MSNKPMTVGQLKALIANVDDATPVGVESCAGMIDRLVSVKVTEVDTLDLHQGAEDEMDEDGPETVLALIFT